LIQKVVLPNKEQQTNNKFLSLFRRKSMD